MSEIIIETQKQDNELLLKAIAAVGNIMCNSSVRNQNEISLSIDAILCIAGFDLDKFYRDRNSDHIFAASKARNELIELNGEILAAKERLIQEQDNLERCRTSKDRYKKEIFALMDKIDELKDELRDAKNDAPENEPIVTDDN